MRIKGYDYAQEGLYFLTICTHDRKMIFGEIQNGEMQLNAAGLIAQNCWNEIPNHFPNVQLHAFVIMPNHVHGIIEITENCGIFKNRNVVDGSVSGSKNVTRAKNVTRSKNVSGAKHISPLKHTENKFSPDFKSPVKTIGSIVRGFKIGVTKWMRDQTGMKTVWQRGYHDRIIKHPNAYFRISIYIKNNPKAWKRDVLNNQ